ncbi:AAA family ATPase [Patescibacteria group bacterium]|nr:AAA family ATPase [Patescibacteria group bacterium]MBU1890142.1 AAA family ATPase [Patescibacteria group bacterium]
MYLQKLEIQGFKSFAQKTSMEFNREIAAVVGPNGSGKSNIADAIRWVMGEQSLKLLRGKKSEDVIFSGSDKKARLGMAEVSLFINNEDGNMPIDYPEVVITRRYYRNGEGEYLLNKQKVRLQDIVLLLAKSNFGQRSYSVIGQGMIDSILTSTPQERKEFFDEAAGVRQFQIKREQAEQKMIRTKENLQQAELLLQEIEPRLRSLTRQVKRLEKRETIEQDLRVIQKEYFSNLWKDLSDQLNQLKQEQTTTDKQHQESSNSLKIIQQKLEQLELETSREEMFRQLQRDYNRILDEKNGLLQEQAVLKGRWEIETTQAGQANRVWLTKRAEALQRLVNEISEDLKPLESVIDITQQSLDKKKQAQSKVIKQFEEIEKSLFLARERLESRPSLQLPEIKEHLEEISNRYDAFIIKLNKAETSDDINRLKRSAREISQSLASYVKEVGRSAPSTTTEQVLKLQNEFSDFLKNKDSLVNEINDQVVKLRTLQEKRTVLMDKRSEVKDEVDRLQNEIARMDRDSKEPDNAQGKFEQDHRELNKKIADLDKQLKTSREKITQFNQEEQQKKDHLFGLQKKFRDHQNSLNSITQKLNEQRVQQARLETRHDDLDREMKDELPEVVYSEIKNNFNNLVGENSSSVLLDKIHQIKRQLDLIGGIDEGITEEFNQTDERYNFLRAQSDDLIQALNSLEKAIAELDETIIKQFNQSFNRINKEFNNYFKMLFKGGSSKLILHKSDILADDEDDLEEDEDDDEEKETSEKPKQKVVGKVVTGIEIQATPPGKRLSNINVLSGGEKALTSIALVCAIISNNPSPFVVLDEVDAALDEANSIKFASILDKLSHKTQFITITHNRATMHKASILYGVTMQADNVSKLLSVKMEEAEEVINKQGNR